MTKRPLLLGALPLLGVALAVGCNCGKKKAPPAPTGRCDIDLSKYAGSAGATARKIDSASDLLKGDSAIGRLNDYLIKNDLIQVIVQAPDRHIAPNPYGGAIVDADVIRGAGEDTSDQFGKVAPFFNFGRTVNPTKVEVVADGSKGPAILAATGNDAVNDYLNVKSLLPLPTPVDADTDLGDLVTTYYILGKGQQNVHIVTAMCNPSGTDQKLAVGDLIDSGGTVEFFNPHSQTGGFGYGGLLPTDFPFYAFWGAKSAYAYAPMHATGNNQLTVSGVVGTLLDSGLGEWLGAPKPPHDAFTVPAHGTATYERDFYVGRSLSEVSGLVYASRGATITLSGTVTVGGQPVAGARVSILADDATFNPSRYPVTVAATAADGTWGAKVPQLASGNYEIAADYQSAARSVTAGQAWDTISGAADGTWNKDLTAPTVVHLHVRDPSGAPIPGKVVVYCDGGTCPVPRGRAGEDGDKFRNSAYDPWPADAQAVVFVDQTGDADVQVPAGTYEFVAAHGPEWSVYPDTWPTDRGAPVVVSGATYDAPTMELAHVVDTTGWMSGDFHVHAVNSPDSPVANLDRVRSFLSEGVDILVATDHDYVTDFTPFMDELDTRSTGSVPKASDEMKTVIGVELTTFDYGHWNGFPLTPSGDVVNQGAFDWAGGTGDGVDPKGIDAALKAMPGASERVVQANHPRGNLGWFTHVRLDNATGVTHACPQQFRLPAIAGCDPAQGSATDTGIWDEGFTAMEIVNDFEEQRIHGRVNDYLTFLSRGFDVTATAVSDTHQLVAASPGYGRTYVKVGVDKPADLDLVKFAHEVNLHHAVASLGAFVTVDAYGDPAGTHGGVGDLVAPDGSGKITLHVEAQAPAWLLNQNAQIEVHVWNPNRKMAWNATGTGADDNGQVAWPGYKGDDWQGAAAEAADFAALGVQMIHPNPATDLVAGADGSPNHFRWDIVHDFVLDTTGLTKDTWAVVIVRRDPAAMHADIEPATQDGNPVSIMALANAVLVDVNRNGTYDPPGVPNASKLPPWPGKIEELQPTTWQAQLPRLEALEREK